MKQSLLVALFSLANYLGFSQPLSQIFESAGNYSWTCPAGVTTIDVECWGAGGGGGGSGSATGGGGSGGGSGAYVKKIGIPVIPCSTYAVVVGTGGFSGSGFTPSVGALEGGASYFESPLTVYASGGCGGMGNRSFAGAGGCSGGSTPGCINVNICVPSATDNVNNFFSAGMSGFFGISNRGGKGGDAPNGGLGGSGSPFGNGQSGKKPGGGGGGGMYSSSGISNVPGFPGDGGFGAAGRVVIYYTPSGSGPVGGTMTGTTELCQKASGITFSYNQGTTDADSWLWTLPSGVSITGGTNTSSEITVDWGLVSGNVTVTPYLNGNAGCPISRFVVAVVGPREPTLQGKTPNSNQFNLGEGVSATFNSGSAGINCVDEYRVFIDGGEPSTYNPGDVVGTDAQSSIVIEGRRSCGSGYGCVDTDFKTMATWGSGTPTFLNPNEKNTYFSILPNPATDVLNIQFRPSFVPQNMQITDALGRVVDTQINSTISIGHLPKGIYHVAVTSSEGRFVLPFVIAH